MEIYEIKGLDCRNLKNRKILVKETMKVTKFDERPSKEALQKICKSLLKKYNYRFKKFKVKENKLFVSIEVSPGSYSTMCCDSMYEVMCKYILFVKALLRNKKLKIDGTVKKENE